MIIVKSKSWSFLVLVEEKNLFDKLLIEMEKTCHFSLRTMRYSVLPIRQILTHFMPLVYFDAPWKHQKTSENLCFSDVFRGYRKRPVAWNGLSRDNNGASSMKICMRLLWCAIDLCRYRAKTCLKCFS